MLSINISQKVLEIVMVKGISMNLVHSCYYKLCHAGHFQRLVSVVFLANNAVVPYHRSEVVLSSPLDNMSLKALLLSKHQRCTICSNCKKLSKCVSSRLARNSQNVSTPLLSCIQNVT